MRKRKLILWDTFFVELRGPSELEKDRTTNRHVNQLRAAFADAATECLRERRKKSAALKRFRIKVAKCVSHPDGPGWSFPVGGCQRSCEHGRLPRREGIRR